MTPRIGVLPLHGTDRDRGGRVVIELNWLSAISEGSVEKPISQWTTSRIGITGILLARMSNSGRPSPSRNLSVVVGYLSTRRCLSRWW